MRLKSLMADRREKELFLFCCSSLSLPLSAVIAGDSWHFFHWEKSAKKQGEVIMLTKPKHSHEQCMSLSHSQVWRGFKVEDGIICKMGKNTSWIRCVVLWCVCVFFFLQQSQKPHYKTTIRVNPITPVNNKFNATACIKVDNSSSLNIFLQS